MSNPITIELPKRCALEALREWYRAREPSVVVLDAVVQGRSLHIIAQGDVGPLATPMDEIFQAWLDRRQPGFSLVDLAVSEPLRVTLSVDDRPASAA